LNQTWSFGNQLKLWPSNCKNLFENRKIKKNTFLKAFILPGLKAYIILLKALMITDFFTNSLQKYEENRLELQELEEESPKSKNKSFQRQNSQTLQVRNDKFLSLPH